MTKALALLLYEKLMPGSELAKKLEAMDYRVIIVLDPSHLAASASREKPMLVVADLTNRRGDVLQAIADLRTDGATAHVPVLAYAPREDDKLRKAASQAGVKVLATETTILPHLAQFVEQALQLD